MKNVTKLAKKSAGLSQKCSICPLMQRCTLEIHRACFDSFVEGFKKGTRAAEKEINKKEVNTKATSINAAKRLFPELDFRRTEKCDNIDDNKVDATLICEYLRRKNY